MTVLPIINDKGWFDFTSSNNDEVSIFLKNPNDNCTCNISTAKIMQCKNQIYINRTFDISKIDKSWYKRKGVSLSSNYSSRSSPKIYKIDFCFDNDEDNFEFLITTIMMMIQKQCVHLMIIL